MLTNNIMLTINDMALLDPFAKSVHNTKCHKECGVVSVYQCTLSALNLHNIVL